MHVEQALTLKLLVMVYRIRNTWTAFEARTVAEERIKNTIKFAFAIIGKLKWYWPKIYIIITC